MRCIGLQTYKTQAIRIPNFQMKRNEHEHPTNIEQLQYLHPICVEVFDAEGLIPI